MKRKSKPPLPLPVFLFITIPPPPRLPLPSLPFCHLSVHHPFISADEEIVDMMSVQQQSSVVFFIPPSHCGFLPLSIEQQIFDSKIDSDIPPLRCGR